MKRSTRAMMLLFGCILAVEGNLLLQLLSWALSVQPHWIVIALVSLVFFYAGLVVASVLVMAARHDPIEDDIGVSADPGHTVARRAAARRSYSEAGAL